jgi:hypothetical protein
MFDTHPPKRKLSVCSLKAASLVITPCVRSRVHPRTGSRMTAKCIAAVSLCGRNPHACSLQRISVCLLSNFQNFCQVRWRIRPPIATALGMKSSGTLREALKVADGKSGCNSGDHDAKTDSVVTAGETAFCSLNAGSALHDWYRRCLVGLLVWVRPTYVNPHAVVLGHNPAASIQRTPSF